MTLPLPDPWAPGTLRHDAVFYLDDLDYVDACGSFVEEGLASDEPVLVAVPTDRLALLRTAYGHRPGVRFVDMARAGRNPSWIIPGVLLAFVERHPDRPVRIVGEPIWPGRSADAYPRCVQHEALINIALAGRPAAVLCPYDAVRLDADVIADAASTHPTVIRAGDRRPSIGYGSPEAVVDALNLPLREPVGTPTTVRFDAHGMSGMRAAVAERATGAGLPAERVADLQVAVSEIATNAVVHSGTSAVLRIWVEPGGVVCEVTGSSVLTDRLAGRVPPPPNSERGRGLLLVNGLCDLVDVHTDEESTTVRLHMFH